MKAKRIIGLGLLVGGTVGGLHAVLSATWGSNLSLYQQVGTTVIWLGIAAAIAIMGVWRILS